jgi:hypothetical protein
MTAAMVRFWGGGGVHYATKWLHVSLKKTRFLAQGVDFA